MDIVSPATRSRMMAGIRGANTKTELTLRKALFALGLRYRLHVKGIPGRPDLIFPKYQAAVFVHGCFWHCHDCSLFKWPSSNSEFWRKKLNSNKARDASNAEKLDRMGWRHLVVWECALKGKKTSEIALVALQVKNWLESPEHRGEIR